MSLKNKKILITAGPTWVPIDNVRIISNISTGETGVLLAEKLQHIGAKVTLLLGPVESCCLNNKIRLIRFKFFDELRNIIKRELKGTQYDLLIHAAAVSDFKPRKFKGKLDSDKTYGLELKPLPKIIRDIRHLAPKTKIVMFKLESGVSDAVLIQRAKVAQIKFGADFVVANRINPYYAFIIDKEDDVISVKSKVELAKKIIKLLVTSY